MSAHYVPIDCEFHDVLEATATGRRAATVRHLDEDGQTRITHARIFDLYAKDGVEYLQLEDGHVIRLDRIVSIDDAQRSAFEERARPRPPTA